VITRIDLDYFKCFELLKLPLSSLTLLSGTNASGKSSILQALVLLHQTIREHEWATRLMLNGNALSLGTVSDIVDQVHGRRIFSIGIIDNEIPFRWVFSGEREEMSMSIDEVTIEDKVTRKPQILHYLFPPSEDKTTFTLTNALRRLTYITAERLGPREVYTLNDPEDATVVGPTGDHAVSLLYSGRDDLILEELALPGYPPTLLRQTIERMRTFFPGCSLEVQQVPHTNVVTLGIRTSDSTQFHRPINAGFGITQILPIIVATLSAVKGDIILVENPEVHLHPAGEALMGRYLALVAQAGVQIIIETHSDHVLNGIRRSVKAKTLTADQVTIHFFKPRDSETAQVVSPQMDDFGNIDVCPEGFFDQFDKDMNYFAGWDS
jgi:predicted ATPase